MWALFATQPNMSGNRWQASGLGVAPLGGSQDFELWVRRPILLVKAVENCSCRRDGPGRN